jgi:GNAT superfamily N-acetyltransferase
MNQLDDDLTVRTYSSGDADQAINLVKLCLGEGSVPRTPAFWRWKHEENPFGVSPGVVAESDTRLVGLRLFLLWNLKLSDETVSAVRAVDTAVHPDFRGRGLFSRLTKRLTDQLKTDGCALVFNTPNRLSRPGYLKLGWHDVGRVPLMVRPIKPTRIVWGAIGGSSDRVDSTPPESFVGKPTIETMLDDPEFDSFLNNLYRGEKRLHTWRTNTFLRWRYLEIPSIQYHARWEVNGESGAAVVFRVRRRKKLTELSLAEVLVSSDITGEQRGVRLIRDLMGEIDAEISAAVAAPPTPERKVLRKCGFFPARWFGPRMTVRPLTQLSEADPKRWPSWRPSLGDLELF